MTTYDFIVVGDGSAGCAVAVQLATHFNCEDAT
ncbi:hypothetical protein BOA8489_01516 [Boseongicola aestuarii]|uniref:Uncharacterized protein n=1 Tax=Boseongicola aestuarii TaxID=1470561 RepID=A0A238IY41_9RHOB|nr:hypothetical protein BOA8489_01516 [Boseongicola aestuarii]